jgi:hypothetical protein
MFISALFTIAKLSMDEWIKKMLYSMENYLALMRTKFFYLQQVDRTGDHHVKQSTPDSDKYCMCSLKHASRSLKSLIAEWGLLKKRQGTSVKGRGMTESNGG